jgi:hypothetical protein
MEASILERMRKGLLQKRDRLTVWLQATRLDIKEVLLGPSSEQSVHGCLDVINDALSKADSKTLGKCEFVMGLLKRNSRKSIIPPEYALSIFLSLSVAIWRVNWNWPGMFRRS